MKNFTGILRFVFAIFQLILEFWRIATGRSLRHVVPDYFISANSWCFCEIRNSYEFLRRHATYKQGFTTRTNVGEFEINSYLGVFGVFKVCM